MNRAKQAARIILLAALILCFMDVVAQIRGNWGGRSGIIIFQKSAEGEEVIGREADGGEEKKQIEMFYGEKLAVLISSLNPELFSESDGKEQKSIFFKAEIVRILEDEYRFKKVGEKEAENQDAFLQFLAPKDICYVDTAVPLFNEAGEVDRYETGIACVKKIDADSAVRRFARVRGEINSREYLEEFFKTLSIMLREPKIKKAEKKLVASASNGRAFSMPIVIHREHLDNDNGSDTISL